MKQKFNLKLTLVAVSLFVSLLLLAFSGKHKVCLFLGLLFLGLNLFAFAFIKVQQINEVLKKTDTELEEYEGEDDALLDEVYKQIRKLKSTRRKTQIVFYITSILLVVMAFVTLF